MALPGWLAEDVDREKLFDDMGTTMLEQLALARFIDTGGLTRHLRRVRPIYRRRRNATLEALSTFLPDAVPTGVAAGLHVYVQLPSDCDESTLVQAANQRGLLIEGASWHFRDSATAPPALVLGYGAVAEHSIRGALAMLGGIYREHRSS